MSQHFVCGFLFDEEGENVLLVRKDKPDWQAGRVNGISDKVEAIDFGYGPAMWREFDEEANHSMKHSRLLPDWKSFAEITVSNGASVVFYKARAPRAELDRRGGLLTDVGERMFVIQTRRLHSYHTILNLRWLIPLALDPEVTNVAQLEMMAS